MHDDTTTATIETDDGLDVRRNQDGRWQVYDTLTDTWIGSDVFNRDQLTANLVYRRRHFRPIIVRWIYGISIESSYHLGVTSGAAR